MDWQHGYYAETGYTYGYHAETMPVRLRWASYLQGHKAPGEKFRYLDAGCGQGFNLVIAALAHPDSEFVGVDFMPEHVAHGRAISRQLGLSNIEFIEGDFVQLAEDPSALGEFDYAVCHGIATWISPDVRRALFRMIGKVLLPGGLFYNSYNTFPGWLGTVPFQKLVLLEQRSKPGQAALKAAQDNLFAILDASPPLMKSQPALKARIEQTQDKDVAYLLQEYNNQFWEPQFVSDMMDALAAVKLELIGSSTLLENFPTHLPAAVRELISNQPVRAIREQMADYAINQSFRRDLYVKGIRKLWPAERDAMLFESRFIANPTAARPKDGEPYKLATGGIEFSGKHEAFAAQIARIAERPDGMSLSEMLRPGGDQPQTATTLENVAMLIQGGWIIPWLGKPATPQAQLLRPLTSIVAQGAPYRYLPLPATGGAVPFADVEWLAIDAMLAGEPLENVPAVALQSARRLNIRLAHSGDQPPSQEAVDRAISQAVARFIEEKAPLLRQCGLI